MKKYLLIAFALFAVFSGVTCDSSEEVLDGIKSKHLKKYLSQHKVDLDNGLESLEKKCPGVSERLKQALKSFQECDEKADDSLTICQAIQSYTLNCTAPLLKVVDECLPPTARGLPTFGLKSLVSIADYLCKQNGESIFELANPCVWEDTEDEENDACEHKIQKIAEKYDHSDHIPSKIEICSTLTGLRGCVQTRVTTSCKNQKTRDAIIGFFDAAVAPCIHLPEETLSSITSNFL